VRSGVESPLGMTEFLRTVWSSGNTAGTGEGAGLDLFAVTDGSQRSPFPEPG